MIVEGEWRVDTLEPVTRCLFLRAVQVADDIGLDVRVISTRRSREDQAELHRKWLECRDASSLVKRIRCRGVLPADPPDETPHVHGMAVDSQAICTPRFAERYLAGVQLSPGTPLGFAPDSSVLTPPLNLPEPGVSCSRVPAFAVRSAWHRILTQLFFVVPLPDTDPNHAEHKDFRKLLRSGCFV